MWYIIDDSQDFADLHEARERVERVFERARAAATLCPLTPVAAYNVVQRERAQLGLAAGVHLCRAVAV
jgi:hypothetical protein